MEFSSRRIFLRLLEATSGSRQFSGFALERLGKSFADVWPLRNHGASRKAAFTDLKCIARFIGKQTDTYKLKYSFRLRRR